MPYIGVQPVDQASMLLTQGTFASSTSTLNVPSGYTPGNIAVYVNGLRLKTSDYTASDGFTISFTESFSVGSEYVVEEFRSFEIADVGGVLVDTSTGTQTIPDALDQRVIYVDTIADLRALTTSGLVDGQQVNVSGWHVNSDIGGGVFYWDVNRPKSEHDGGVVISPTVPTVDEQPGANLSEKTAAFVNGDGETDSAGSGCHVRQGVAHEYHLDWYGGNAAGVIAAMNRGDTLLLSGEIDVSFSGRFLSYKAIHIRGTGFSSEAPEATVDTGTVIINTGPDVVDGPVIQIFPPDREHYASIKDISIRHEGATTFAVVLKNVVQTTIDTVKIYLNKLGYGGVRYDLLAFFSTAKRLGVFNFTTYGVLVTGSGSEHVFHDSFVASSEPGSVGIETRVNGTRIHGGQINCNNTVTPCKSIYFNNDATVDRFDGVVDGVLMENIQAGSWGVFIGGNTNRFKNVTITNLRCSLDFNKGTLVYFGQADDCTLINPKVMDVQSGGTLVEFGAPSKHCGIQTSSLTSSQAPLIVSEFADSIYKIIDCPLTDTELSSVTTSPHLIAKASWINSWYSSARWEGTVWYAEGDYATTDTLTGNIAIGPEKGNALFLDANGADRSIFGNAGHDRAGARLVLHHTGADGRLLFKATSPQTVLNPGESGQFVYNGTEWVPV